MGLHLPASCLLYPAASYLILVCAGLSPGEFIHVIGDAHVYRNHVVPLEEQLARQPKPFPVSSLILLFFLSHLFVNNIGNTFDARLV